MKLSVPTLAAFGATALTLLAQPALAAESTQVRYGDLDLATDTGRAMLDHRIEVAAGRVCRVDVPTGSIIRNVARERQCKVELRRQVESRIAARPSAENLGG